MESKNCLRRREARAVWDRCKPSSPRRNSKTGEPARCCRRRAKPFLPLLSDSRGNQAYLPDPLWRPSREGVAHSRSLNFAPNSIGSESSPATSRVPPLADPKRHAPLGTDTAPLKAKKGNWTEAAYEGPYSSRQQIVLRFLAYSGSQSRGLTQDWKKPSQPCASTLFFASRIDPGKPPFQRANGSPGQAIPSPHCEDADNRPVCGPSVFQLATATWRDIVPVSADSSQTEEIETTNKGDRGRCTRRVISSAYARPLPACCRQRELRAEPDLPPHP